MQVNIMQKLLIANERKANELRALMKEKQILMVNLISSPGSGKTTLLEKTIPLLRAKHYRVAVIEGDVETDRDAQRLRACGAPVVSITTSGACHLESVSIEKAFDALNLDQLDIIFVENVGNLVCPAEFDIGEDAKVALLSTPEGDDKVGKYPLLFQEAALVILNKVDLLAFLPFKESYFEEDLSQINPHAPVIKMAAQQAMGLDSWIDWLEKATAKKKIKI
ncbi:MAG: hydrogenase accessory protein HypB [Gammaproteobacteria bacterium GWE2_42_36]|nr:MAG: hydrogenase accessory protein HypB [Gammaproteobacteria bacterium GWE2_42_36]HCU05047.1 hydrogenase accessory protein HypB [Coxiellaceae bacterium]